ncbi:hypothetical protein VdG1_00610 [Verticillium dahliae VDG1]|nr:hypothetical protein VdG1_00610 [Verticillium dahliae VDG1]
MGAFPKFRLLRLPLKIIRMVIDHLSQSDTISLAQTGRVMAKVATHSIYFKDRDSGRQWALNLGCDLGRVDLVQKAIEYRYDLNRLTDEGVPLSRAVRHPHLGDKISVVEMLLRNGADPSLGSSHPLLTHFAQNNGLVLGRCHTTIPTLLLTHGARPSAIESSGIRLINLAIDRADNLCCHSHGPAAGSDESVAVVPFGVAYDLCALLLQSGANPNCIKGGEMPLQKLASAEGFNEKDRMLLAGLLMAGGAWE